MLRGQATKTGSTLAAVNTSGNRGKSYAPRVGATNKTGGNTFASVPTVAVRKATNQAAR